METTLLEKPSTGVRNEFPGRGKTAEAREEANRYDLSRLDFLAVPRLHDSSFGYAPGLVCT